MTNPELITDGFGTYWQRYCPDCGDEIAIMRPGEARCIRCYDSLKDKEEAQNLFVTNNYINENTELLGRIEKKLDEIFFIAAMVFIVLSLVTGLGLLVKTLYAYLGIL